MPHKYYHGKTGVVWNVTKRAVGACLFLSLYLSSSRCPLPLSLSLLVALPLSLCSLPSSLLLPLH
jgi:hypothetical protein